MEFFVVGVFFIIVFSICSVELGCFGSNVFIELSLFCVVMDEVYNNDVNRNVSN